MDPIAANLQSILNTLQAASSAQALPTLETPALAALLGLGQEVDLLLQALEPEGAVLQLPSGQTLNAQGELPYAEGTQLRVRVEPAPAGEAGLRLQVLEARPPALPAILAPLSQGEAWSLMARLQDAQTTPELEPLAQLLRLFTASDAREETPSAPADVQGQSLLPQAKLVAAIQEAPAALVRGLATILGTPSGDPAELAARLLALAQEPAPQTSAPAQASARSTPSPAPETANVPLPQRIQADFQAFLAQHPELPQAERKALGDWASRILQGAPEEDPALQRVQDLLRAPGTSPTELQEALREWEAAAPRETAALVIQRFQALAARHPETVPDAQDSLGGWVRQLVAKAFGNEAEAQDRPVAPRAGQAAAQPSAAPAVSRANPSAAPTPSALGPVAQGLQSLIHARGVASAALPESWEAWVRGAVQTLADPQASPREAPFHALQAQERTGFFEVPLPWAGQGTLQLWVEQDAQRDRGGSPDDQRRVLLGLHFSRLGETRIGMETSPGTLRVRIWTEHPEAIQFESASLESELAGLGNSVELRILPLSPGADGTIPSLRAAVAGSSLQAMG